MQGRNDQIGYVGGKWWNIQSNCTKKPQGMEMVTIQASMLNMDRGQGLGYIGCKAIARAWTSHQLEHAHTKDARA